MDKNSQRANLPRTPTTYLRRMYTDTVSPHAMGVRFAIEFYGVEQVMYGTDYPCWSPAACLKVLEEVGLSAADTQKIMYDNARRFFNLDAH
jgi:aminocarboxymuconate-semialdehyde decarboxylase